MKPSLIDYFPSKLAKAPRFCNRLEERKRLKNNINLGRHTVLVSPRRYGKTSLVQHVVKEMKIPCASVDLFLAHDGKAITKRILDGISEAISQILPLRIRFSRTALTVVQRFFSHFKIVLEVSGFGFQLSHELSGFDPAEQIFEALKSLANLAESRQKKVLLFLDEFQDIKNADNSKSIQGALRNVAQDTSGNLVFVFSGSNRHLLLELFDDKNKPLYMLCDKLLLDRMSSADYKPYIQDAAKSQWGRAVDNAVLNRIFLLTELHPFYVNLLCRELWKGKRPAIENNYSVTEDGKWGGDETSNYLITEPINRDDVIKAWITCYETEERRLISELEKLTSNQQDILKFLAQTPVREVSSRKFLEEVGLSLSSMRAGIKALLEKDMIDCVKKEDANIPHLKKGQYHVLDPLLAYALRKYR